MIEYILDETRRDERKNWFRTDMAMFALMIAICAIILSIFAAVVL